MVRKVRFGIKLWTARSSRHVANLGDDEISYFVLAPDDNTFAFIRGKWIYQAVLIEGLQ